MTKSKAVTKKLVQGRPAAGRSATVSKASYSKPAEIGKTRSRATPRLGVSQRELRKQIVSVIPLSKKEDRISPQMVVDKTTALEKNNSTTDSSKLILPKDIRNSVKKPLVTSPTPSPYMSPQSDAVNFRLPAKLPASKPIKKAPKPPKTTVPKSKLKGKT